MRHLSFLLALCVVFAGCSASSQVAASSAVAKYQGATFNNILVIGVAQDYNGRARFERNLVSALSKHDVTAVAYYRAVGGNKPINREAIEQLVKAEGFDAVLITRVLNRDIAAQSKTGSAATKSVRKDEGALKLFRYDYEELNEPATLSVGVSVKLSSEVFDTDTGDLVWAIESNISKKDMTDRIVDEAVTIIVRRLQKDSLIS